MTKTFADIGIGSELTTKLKQSGLNIPTPVQAQAIPNLLSGKDVIAQAQTGTGKTLAFVLPILEKIKPEVSCVQALIITPTRELAIQITAEVKKLAPIVGASVLAAYGGQDVEAQIHKLNKQKGSPHIVVGTPGRILDHIRRETINLSRVTMLVLDEADQMLHIGFLAEVEEIIRQLPYKRQTMLFSATMSDQVRRLAADYMRSPIDIHIQGKKITLEGTKQYVVETSDRDKQDKLLSLIKIHQPFLAVVFCRTKVRAKTLTAALQDNGYDADELHGDLTQAKRENVMKRFRDAKLQILVATDVAARGLDVEGVSHVYNYDIPHDVESYIHRIGRTGRAGQRGIAITFAAPKDRAHLQDIERGTNSTLEQMEAETGNRIARVGSGRVERNDRSSSNRRNGQRGERGSSDRNFRSGGRSDRGPKAATRGESRTKDSRTDARAKDSRFDSRADDIRVDSRSSAGGRSDARSTGRGDNKPRTGGADWGAKGSRRTTGTTGTRADRGASGKRNDSKVRGEGDLSVESRPSRPVRGAQDSNNRRGSREGAEPRAKGAATDRFNPKGNQDRRFSSAGPERAERTGRADRSERRTTTNSYKSDSKPSGSFSQRDGRGASTRNNKQPGGRRGR